MQTCVTTKMSHIMQVLNQLLVCNEHASVQCLKYEAYLFLSLIVNLTIIVSRATGKPQKQDTHKTFSLIITMSSSLSVITHTNGMFCLSALTSNNKVKIMS